MSKPNTKVIKNQGKNSDVNSEGNEKTDNTSSTVADLATYTLQDDNAKVAGLAAGYREATKTK